MDSINHVYDKVLSGYLYMDVFVYRDWPEKFLGKNLGLDEINLLKENEAVLRRNLEEILGTFILHGRLSDSIWIKDKIFIGDEGICLLGEILTICQISTYIDSEEMIDIRSNEKFKNNMMQKLNKKLLKRKNALEQEKQMNVNKQMCNVEGKECLSNIKPNKTASDSVEKAIKNKQQGFVKKGMKEISVEEFILPSGEDVGHKYICILLNAGGKQQVRILRFEKNCTYADKLLETLKGTVTFLHNLRYLFKEFRSQVVLKEKIRREFHAFINFRRSDPNFTGSKAIPEFFNSLHQKAIQPLYLGLNEHYLSLLEEAISYCPIVTYAFYNNIFLLKQIDVNMPRRTWRSVSNLQRKYKNWKKMLENGKELTETDSTCDVICKSKTIQCSKKPRNSRTYKNSMYYNSNNNNSNSGMDLSEQSMQGNGEKMQAQVAKLTNTSSMTSTELNYANFYKRFTPEAGSSDLFPECDRVVVSNYKEINESDEEDDVCLNITYSYKNHQCVYGQNENAKDMIHSSVGSAYNKKVEPKNVKSCNGNCYRRRTPQRRNSLDGRVEVMQYNNNHSAVDCEIVKRNSWISMNHCKKCKVERYCKECNTCIDKGISNCSYVCNQCSSKHSADHCIKNDWHNQTIHVPGPNELSHSRRTLNETQTSMYDEAMYQKTASVYDVHTNNVSHSKLNESNLNKTILYVTSDGGLLEDSKEPQKEAQLQHQESNQEQSLIRRGSSLEGPRSGMVKLFKTYGGQCRIGKVHGRCEDATFQTDVPPAFGIFDGVGSWSLEGIDASKFSIGLALACQREAEKLSNNMNGYINMPYNTIARSKTLLKNSHESVKADYNEAYGSSTAIVGIIDEFSGKCGISSLGDSVCMILRREFMPESITFDRESYPKFNAEAFLFFNEKGRNPSLVRKVIWKTTEQKWDNGAPYQLSNLPGRSEWKDLERKGLQNFVKILEKVDIEGDSPDMASSPSSEILCMPGDLILCMSDGVCDNLFDEEIEAYCTFAISPEEALEMGDPSLFTPAQDIAYAITNIAKRRSGDKVHYKPFLPFIGKYREPNRMYKGGKVDDISCVAVWVVCETEQSVKHILQSIDHVSSLETDPFYTSQLAQNEEELDENLTPIKGYAKNKHKIERVNLEQSAMEVSYATTTHHMGGIMHEHQQTERTGVVPKMSAMFDASETPIKFEDSKRGGNKGSQKCADLSEIEFKDPEEGEEEKGKIGGDKFDDDTLDQTPSQREYIEKPGLVKNLSDPIEDFENIYINTPPIFSDQSSKLNQKNLRNSGQNRDIGMGIGGIGILGAGTATTELGVGGGELGEGTVVGNVGSGVEATEVGTVQQFMNNSFYETPIKGRSYTREHEKTEEEVLQFDDNISNNDQGEENPKETEEEDPSSGAKRKTKRDKLDSPLKLGVVKKKAKK